MLVLTRKPQQQIQIGDNITITIVRVTGQSVRVGIEAPQEVRVIRGELSGTEKPIKGAQSSVAAPATSAGACNASNSPSPTSEPAAHAAPLASRCRNRLLMPRIADAPSAMPAESATCSADRRRASGASFTSTIRRSQRLGPASLNAMACRMR